GAQQLAARAVGGAEIAAQRVSGYFERAGDAAGLQLEDHVVALGPGAGGFGKCTHAGSLQGGGRAARNLPGGKCRAGQGAWPGTPLAALLGPALMGTHMPRRVWPSLPVSRLLDGNSDAPQ